MEPGFYFNPLGIYNLNESGIVLNAATNLESAGDILYNVKMPDDFHIFGLSRQIEIINDLIEETKMLNNWLEDRLIGYNALIASMAEENMDIDLVNITTRRERTPEEWIRLLQEARHVDVSEGREILPSHTGHRSDISEWGENEKFEVIDLTTGASWYMIYLNNSGSHVDVVPASAEDAAIMRNATGMGEGTGSFIHRPMLVVHDDNVLITTMHTRIHGGGPAGNDFNGHVCLWFRNSRNSNERTQGRTHRESLENSQNLIDAHIERWTTQIPPQPTPNPIISTPPSIPDPVIPTPQPTPDPVIPTPPPTQDPNIPSQPTPEPDPDQPLIP